ncbi:MAG: alanine--glyoxylate aminotransferase family protein [Candidatus Omnitrophica bacterium]|nr:alanine--glyoxylate aminotransferase family protein [Candidatus Omnitrophota bacterium]
MTNGPILLTPGPVQIPESVRAVMAQPIFHHRTPRFRELFERVTGKLKFVFRTQNPVYTLVGSGSAGMEAAVVNFHSPGDEVLVLDTGKFGSRFTELARVFGLCPRVIEVPWGEAVDPSQFEKALTQFPRVKSVFVQLCETSTAVLNDIRAIGEKVRRTDALLIVDAIAGLAADVLETDAWAVDAVIGGSQKALMLPPGLAFISVSPKAQARMRQSSLPRYYFDLQKYEKNLVSGDTPFTPGTMLVWAADEALDLILSEGLENVWARSRELGDFTRAELSAMGFRIFSKAPSSSLTAAVFPEGFDAKKFIRLLREQKNVTVAGGQGAMKNRMMRVAHMGSIGKEELQAGFQAMREILAGMEKSEQRVA